MEKTDITIIGAGVIGLAIAYELARDGKDVVVLERHPGFGQEASSRNSEVIHAGIYYAKDSLKAKLCVEGNKLLYEFCSEHGVSHRQLGKLIVAAKKEEIGVLEDLICRGKNNGLNGLKMFSKKEIREVEPHVAGCAAIFVPSTGIVDSHQLMKCLEWLAKDNGAIFAYNCEVVAIRKGLDIYSLDVRDASGVELTIMSRIIINCAGLNSDKVASMAGIDIEKERYKQHYCKGEYFKVGGKKSDFINHLLYPTPKTHSLGIHTVTDLMGQLKLGPNAFYIDEIDYDVEAPHKREFYEATKSFLPFIKLEDLHPDMSGIRAKLKGPNEEEERDFVISEESDKGYPGLMNLIGIESPGLTAALAIAKYVNQLLPK